MKHTPLLQTAIFHDQTYLVDSILKEQSETTHFCQWYNHLFFNVKLAEEEFTGNLKELDQRTEEMKNQLKSMLQQVAGDESLSGTTLYSMTVTQLKEDIRLLEAAEGRKERVFQWLLVPYWLSEELIDKGELVLRVYGNNWWGITRQTKTLDDTGNLSWHLFSQI